MSDSPWPHFSIRELSCKCGCGRWEMNAEFMEKMERLRLSYGFPIYPTSAMRCEVHDMAVGSSSEPGKGPHTWGHAMDVRVYGRRALRFVEAAFKIGGFTGIGLSQKGDVNSRFIHIDDLEGHEARSPRPWIWTY